MTVYQIPTDLRFPDPHLADESGLLGVGGDLAVERLLLAYRSGIFPWYSDDQPILWWSPDPRMVLFPKELHIPKSLKKLLKNHPFVLRMDSAFEQVITQCMGVPRPGQDGTWITPEMKDAYMDLHLAGYAHSMEVWEGERLVGGLYGVAVGGVFCGESMFTLVPNASKIALVTLIEQLHTLGFTLLDCQVHTDHLERFGAKFISKSDYLTRLRDIAHVDIGVGSWQLPAK